MFTYIARKRYDGKQTKGEHMDLLQQIQNNSSAPYVYAYPPSRCYESLGNFYWQAIDFSDDINLYVHIPFCAQKCSFCGYLTTVSEKMAEHTQYVDALIKEISAWPVRSGMVVRSINFGGGTPLLLETKLIEQILARIERSFPGSLNSATEISIEGTPDSVDAKKLEHLVALGFNRLSLGIQTLSDSELIGTKRGNLSDSSLKAIAVAKQAGIANLCCDLMYGLPEQTLESWEETVRRLIELRPETIELYRTVVIPGTGLFRIVNNARLSPAEQRQAYESARAALLKVGYVPDSHLRFIIPEKGFYRQQSNVFAGQSLIGFGAGARSYAKNIHYRNCYGPTDREAIKRYIAKQSESLAVIEEGIFLGTNEQLRRHIIYNLECLDLLDIKNVYGIDINQHYSAEWNALEKAGLIVRRKQTICLTEKAVYDRDLIAAYFFSKKATALEQSYYGDCHEK